MRNLYIIILVGVMGLAACGGDQQTTGGSSRSLEVTIPAADPRTLIEGCPVEELEDWFEVSFFPMRDFVDRAQFEARKAQDGRRNEIDVVLDELVAIRDRVNNVTTPHCVEARHTTIVTNMQVIVDDFQLFANAEISAEELEERVSEDIQSLRQMLDTLEDEVRPLFQLESSS